jgi:hypothetical protein
VIIERDGGEVWRERFRAVAKAQTHYLYSLGTAGVFFFALHLALPDTATTELLGVPVSAEFVWATAPSVLGFLLAATLGAIKATGQASIRMRLTGGDFEREDTWPNALDMAVYTTKDSHRLVLAFGHLTYSAYLTLFFVEGLWLWWMLFRMPDRGAPLHVAFFVGAAMLLLGGARLRPYVLANLRHCWRALRGKKDPMSMVYAVGVLAEIEELLQQMGQGVTTEHVDGPYRLLVEGKEIASGDSVPDLAESALKWFDASGLAVVAVVPKGRQP